MIKDLIDINEAAELLEVKKSSVYFWTHTKTIPHYKIGRKLWFKKEDLVKWVNKKRVAIKKEI